MTCYGTYGRPFNYISVFGDSISNLRKEMLIEMFKLGINTCQKKDIADVQPQTNVTEDFKVCSAD